MTNVFFIDDERDIRDAIEQSFELEDIAARYFPDAESALVALQSGESASVIISDICLPGVSGTSLLQTIQHRYPTIPVILITGHGDISMAVEAMQNGAYHFIEKPFSPEHLIETTKRAIEQYQLKKENQQLKDDLKASKSLGPRIIGEAPAIHLLRDTIRHICDTNADVLIFGETGTGKELVARSLHEQSHRREKNFVAINCGAIPEHLIESELYGHEKGAFTGAEQLRIGKIEHAEGGTLFLDEIESMPMQAQIRLLRVLQEREIERIGSNQLKSVDIRVVAATKIDLKKAAESGTFRLDLYYRLNIVTLEIPPLRERKEDIISLFHHFHLVAASRYGREAVALTPDENQQLYQHEWTGNVRELRNTAERFVLLNRLDIAAKDSSATGAVSGSLSEQMATFERAVLEQTLIQQFGSIKGTMASLSIPRKTLYDKMQKHGLDKENYKSNDQIS